MIRLVRLLKSRKRLLGKSLIYFNNQKVALGDLFLCCKSSKAVVMLVVRIWAVLMRTLLMGIVQMRTLLMRIARMRIVRMRIVRIMYIMFKLYRLQIICRAS